MLHVLLNLSRYVPANNDIGDGKAPARFEYPKRFFHYAVLIA